MPSNDVQYLRVVALLLWTMLPNVHSAAFFYGATETREAEVRSTNTSPESDEQFDVDELRVAYDFCRHLPLMVRHRVAKADDKTQRVCQQLLKHLSPLFKDSK
ncbi:hypothetical protein AAVH_11565 [Aphelenchoides avenae]|nr:hypothetical protein AAVH_11565 [Aphelenchus avenae]